MRHAIGVLTALAMVFVLACSSQLQKSGNTPSLESEIAGLKKQLETSPNSAYLHAQLAVLWSVQGDEEASDSETSAALRLDPNNPIFLIEAAQNYSARGMKPKAIEMLNRAVAVDPQNPLSHFSLGVMYERQSNTDRAFAEYRETKRLIDTLSLSAPSPGVRNQIIKGTDGETWYHDAFGKDYLLDEIIVPLKNKLSKQSSSQ